MKKSLSLILAIAMVFSMFASVAFAANESTELTTEDKYAALEEIGIFEGDDTGANLEGLTKREQFAKILALVFGLKEDAATANATYNDLDQSKWAVGFIGAVTKAGLMEGAWEGEFRPLLEISIEELATVAARAFKLTIDEDAEVEGETSSWATGYVAAALEAELIAEYEDYTVSATRADLVELAYAAYLKAQAELSVAKIAGVKAISNTAIEVSLKDAVTVAKAADFTIEATEYGTGALEVKGAALVDEKTIEITTAKQAAGVLYTVKANGTEGQFVGEVADESPLSVVALDTKAIANTVVEVKFSKDVNAGALNASNYTFNNDLKALSVKFKKDTKNTVQITTTAQSNESAVYTLTVKNVSDLDGNVIEANGTVNTAMFASVPVDDSKIYLVAVHSLNNQTVRVLFDKDVDASTAGNIANYSIKDLTVLAAKVDGDEVTLTTSSQKEVAYNLVASNIVSLAGAGFETNGNSFPFGGVPVDTTPPTVEFAMADSNTLVTVKFDKMLEGASAEDVANYSITELEVKSAKLLSDKKTVELTTASQADNKVHTVTVTNVKDVDGNTIKAPDNKGIFASVEVDTTAPAVATANAYDSNWVIVTFNEKVSAETAKTPYNYNFGSKLKYGIQVMSGAEFNASNPGAGMAVDGKEWAVKTATQANEVYEVVVKGVKDLSGNVIGSANKATFAGKQGTVATTSLKLDNIAMAQDNQSVELIFNKDVSALFGAADYEIGVINGTESSATGYGIADNSTNPAVSKIGNVATKNGGKTVVIYFNNKMTSGVLYSVKVTNMTGLDTDYNTARFAGSSKAYKNAEVEQVGLASNEQTMTVTFTKPVEGPWADVASLKVTNKGNSSANLGPVNYTNNPIVILATDGLSATIYFDEPVLVKGALYEVELDDVYDVVSGDALAADKVTARIAGNDKKVVAPTAFAVANNINTYTITFDQDVDLSTVSAANFDFYLDKDGNNLAGVAIAKIEVIADKNTVVLHTVDFGNLTVGVASYIEFVNPLVVNYNGKAMADAMMVFAPTKKENPAPQMVAAKVNGANVEITFSESIAGTTAADVSKITINGTAVTAAIANGKVLTVTPGAALVTGLNTIELSANNGVKDYAGVGEAKAGTYKFVN